MEAPAGPPAVGCGVEVCAEDGPAAAFTGANCVAGTVLDEGVAAAGFVEVMGLGPALANGDGWVCGMAAGCGCAWKAVLTAVKPPEAGGAGVCDGADPAMGVSSSSARTKRAAEMSLLREAVSDFRGGIVGVCSGVGDDQSD